MSNEINLQLYTQHCLVSTGMTGILTKTLTTRSSNESREYTCKERSLHCVIYTQLEPHEHVPASQGALSIIWTVISDNLTASSEHVLLQLYTELNQQHPVLPQLAAQESKRDGCCVQHYRDYRKCIYSTSRFNLQKSLTKKCQH